MDEWVLLPGPLQILMRRGVCAPAFLFNTSADAFGNVYAPELANIL